MCRRHTALLRDLDQRLPYALLRAIRAVGAAPNATPNRTDLMLRRLLHEASCETQKPRLGVCGVHRISVRRFIRSDARGHHLTRARCNAVYGNTAPTRAQRRTPWAAPRNPRHVPEPRAATGAARHSIRIWPRLLRFATIFVQPSSEHQIRVVGHLVVSARIS